MPRHLLLLLLLAALPSCAGNGSGQSSADDTFNRETVQTYNVQNREFEQQPPFGPRADR